MGPLRRLKGGFTLHEMLMSLAVTGVVLGLAVDAARRQLVFHRKVAVAATQNAQLAQATGIAANLLWGVSAAAGDIVAAHDSALELRLPIGSAVVCSSSSGRVTIPAPSDSPGNVLAAFAESPQPDDQMFALMEDSASTTWLGTRVTAPPARGDGCPPFPGVSATWIIELQEQLTLPVGAVVRFARPFRLSLYRGADGRFFLGARDWNGTARRFNGIQPVAGPLRPYSPDETQTGLLFEYCDARGAPMPAPIDRGHIASIRIVARGDSDSIVAAIGLRNR